MSAPTLPTIKHLFAVSGNRCAFPKCALPLVDESSSKITGRICHIKAQSPKGPRYDPDQTEEERHAFGNLLLLCPYHHEVIDYDVETYTVERLLQIKLEHEKAHSGGREPSVDVANTLIELDTAGDLPQPQQTRWGPVDGRPAGISINSCTGPFIPWKELKGEVENILLRQVRLVPIGSTVILGDFRGRKD